MNETLSSWIKESKRIVFFGGAGVSTESGIPDFRSVDGSITSSMTIRLRRYSATPFFMRQARGILPLLSQQDALPQRPAQRGP